MSKAFTSEETPDEPLVVRPRAPLPAGVPNYVTARGLALLRAELAALEGERAAIAHDGDGDAERARRRAAHAARVAELRERIASARVVDPRGQPHDTVRFGATVDLTDADGARQRYTIVGVDEADPAEGRIAFLAPLARALLGLQVGDVATLRTAAGRQAFEVDGISYDVEP